MVIDPGDRLQQFIRYNLKTQRFQIFQTMSVGLELHTLSQLNVEDIDIKTSGSRDLRIQLAQRTGGSVAGIGKQGFSLCLLSFVQRREAFLGHEHFTPDDQPRRGASKLHRNGADGL